MNKKVIGLLICCIMGISLCACGKTSSKNQSEQVTIRFSWWGTESRYDKTMEAVKLFEEKNPNIKVKAEFGEWTGFKKKMNMKIAGNDEPDLMQINYDWLENYSKDGKGFYDLSKLSDTLKFDNFPKEVLAYGTKNNILNAIPISTNAKILYYNKNVSSGFIENRYDTWDALIASGSKTNGDTYPLDLDSFNAWGLCMAYVQEKTGRNFINEDGSLGFTQGDIQELLLFYKKLVDNKVLPSTTRKDDNSSFNSGKAGATISWSTDAQKMKSGTEKIKGDLFSGTFPASGGANPISYVKPSMLYTISKNTEHPKEAAMLMDFMLNDEEAAKIIGMDRGLPTSTSSYKALEEGNVLSGLQYEASKKEDGVKEILISPYYENTLIKNTCETAIEEITYNKSTPEQCAANTYNNLIKTLETVTK
ncbi:MULTISPECIES: ABC transporter substrate-binding protein [Clostridium]|uniref:Carbohydrate ABC transporter substrate-binding protein n=1 Tax=Clostridium cibarium TaxID=2762247 RepID=A0ABR8PR78_9CLOT|nr:MULTISPECIES: ABC transporter substrate-binding protein [Clostridium]MBD7910680.1 carbohydrate ABC transporter substrate-binding protein [Clostridium cibarium]